MSLKNSFVVDDSSSNQSDLSSGNLYSFRNDASLSFDMISSPESTPTTSKRTSGSKPSAKFSLRVLPDLPPKVRQTTVAMLKERKKGSGAAKTKTSTSTSSKTGSSQTGSAKKGSSKTRSSKTGADRTGAPETGAVAKIKNRRRKIVKKSKGSSTPSRKERAEAARAARKERLLAAQRERAEAAEEAARAAKEATRAKKEAARAEKEAAKKERAEAAKRRKSAGSSKPKRVSLTPAERRIRTKELTAEKQKMVNTSIAMLRLHVPGCINIKDKVNHL